MRIARHVAWGLLLVSAVSFAGDSSDENTAPRGDDPWNLHSGTYIGALLGFNANKIHFYNLTTQSKTITQELLGGYLFSPYFGAELAAGSYFSGEGLGLRLSGKFVLPIQNKWTLSTDLGVAYVSQFFSKGFMGPYLAGNAAYALSDNIDWNFTVNDMISSWKISNNKNVSDHYLSLLTGFSYHIGG